MMDYTLIEEYYINGQNLSLEKELLAVWTKFCLKSKPLPIFHNDKTVSQRISTAKGYFYENFAENRCFFVRRKGFVVFGDSQKWLDEPIPELFGKKVAVLIMAASLNESCKESWHKILFLKECFRRLKAENYDVIAWNLNRQHKRRAFARMIQTLGAKELRSCQYVEL
jgi:hypothetical protein